MAIFLQNTFVYAVVLIVLFASLPSDAVITRKSFIQSRKLVHHSLRNLVPITVRGILRAATKRVRKEMKEAGGCEVTVCFAMEGSKSISSDTYLLQKAFVAVTSAVLSTDSSTSLSAVQFSRGANSIAPKTSNARGFVYQVANSSRSSQHDVNMAAGLGYCGFQTRGATSGQKIVFIIGSGLSTVGFAPEIITKQILPPAGSTEIYAISTGGKSDSFLSVVGGDTLRVISLKKHMDLPAIVEIVSSRVCDLNFCNINEKTCVCTQEPTPALSKDY